jgi:anti-sigma factor RsiW
MTSLSNRDLELLSASLDGQLSPEESARLQTRLAADPGLRAAQDGLRVTRALLRRTPQRRASRNFTLAPGMAGVRPPLPRLVPAFSWASAVAVLLLLFTFAAPLAGEFASRSVSMAAAPMAATAPAFDHANQAYGLGKAATAAATAAPVAAATAAPSLLMTAPLASTAEATIAPGGRTAAPLTTALAKKPAPVFPLTVLQLVLIGLAVLLAVAAVLLRWQRLHAFARPPKK